MRLSQETDQVTYSFLFVITPLQVISTKSNKNLKKSLLLKLGNITQKTTQLNRPIEIPVQVLYSKTLKKYCPIKGIIKVYDINSDGTEVISSVGGFQTEEILNQQQKDVIIQRDVGTSKVKMKIQIRNLGTFNKNSVINQKQAQLKLQQPVKSLKSVKPSQQTSVQNKSKSLSGYIEDLVTGQRTQRINQLNRKNQEREKNDEKGEKNDDKGVKKDYKSDKNDKKGDKNDKKGDKQQVNQLERSLESNQDTKKVCQQMPSLKTIQFIKKDQPKTHEKAIKTVTIQKNFLLNPIKTENKILKQRQNLSQILIEDNTVSQQEIENKNQLENSYQFKNKLLFQKEKKWKEILIHFRNIQECFEYSNGEIRIQFNEKLRMLNQKYQSKQFEKVFNEFFSFIKTQLLSYSINTDQNSSNFLPSQTIPSESEQNLTHQIKKLNQELNTKTTQNNSLRTIQIQKTGIQMKLKLKQEECIELQNLIKDIQSFNKTLKEENNYLKKKDQTMQQILTEKQHQIEILKQQITEIQLQYQQLRSTIKNDLCQIEQLKEEVSNLNQTIDTYRVKYGDLKNTKSRALENQLKECLIWIDQQTRELQMSDFAQETQPSLSHNVSEIIKSIEIEGASRQEMNSIKEELAGLIKRIDNFLAK